MGKPLQRDEDGNIMNDDVTKENQKGYENYEAELKKSGSYRSGQFKDEKPLMERIGNKIGNVIEPIYNSIVPLAKPNSKKDNDVVRKAKGGKISSASKRADGCCTKGKTRGRMV
jgi:hypothetical protein